MKLSTKLWNQFASKVEDYIDAQPPTVELMTLDQCVKEIHNLANLPVPEASQQLLRLAQLAQIAYDAAFFDRATAYKHVQAGRAVRISSEANPLFVLTEISGDQLTGFLNANYSVAGGVPLSDIKKHYLTILPNGQIAVRKDFPELYCEWRLASNEEIRKALEQKPEA